MLRSALLWASTSELMAGSLPRYGFVRRAVRRFMPGETMADAFREAEAFRALGTPTLVTELGENVDTVAAARKVVDEYLALAEGIRERGLDMELSVKPTHLGLDLGEATALAHILEVARAAPGTVWLDMEASGYVEATLLLFEAARAEVENVGICLQAYLHRTEADYERLLPLRPAVRLVKGAYLEPPEVAMPSKADVDAAYDRLAGRILRDRAGGTGGFLGLGTHDRLRIEAAAGEAARLGLDGDDWEVEMLYGIATTEQGRLRRNGTPLRILISYGTHWFPWYMRRLAERPANVGFVLRQMVRR